MGTEGARGPSLLRNSIALPLVHVCTAVGLFSYHANAEYTTVDSSERSLMERLALGPEYFTTMDKVLFAIIILLGLELINFVAHNSGCKKFSPYVLSYCQNTFLTYFCQIGWIARQFRFGGSTWMT